MPFSRKAFGWCGYSHSGELHSTGCSMYRNVILPNIRMPFGRIQSATCSLIENTPTARLTQISIDRMCYLVDCRLAEYTVRPTMSSNQMPFDRSPKWPKSYNWTSRLDECRLAQNLIYWKLDRPNILFVNNFLNKGVRVECCLAGKRLVEFLLIENPISLYSA